MADSCNVCEGRLKFRVGKKWKERFCILNKPSPVANLLNIYLSKDYRKSNTKEPISLESFCGICTGFQLDGESSVMAIICRQKVVLLAFINVETLRFWRAAVNKHLGEEICFTAELVKAPSSLKLVLPCPVNLFINQAIICLATDVGLGGSSASPQYLGSWNFKDLHRFGILDSKFCFEVRCSTGNEVYSLTSQHCSDINQLFESKRLSQLRSNTSVPSPNLVTARCRISVPISNPCTPSYDSNRRHPIDLTPSPSRSSLNHHVSGLQHSKDTRDSGLQNSGNILNTRTQAAVIPKKERPKNGLNKWSSDWDLNRSIAGDKPAMRLKLSRSLSLICQSSSEWQNVKENTDPAYRSAKKSVLNNYANIQIDSFQHIEKFKNPENKNRVSSAKVSGFQAACPELKPRPKSGVLQFNTRLSCHAEASDRRYGRNGIVCNSQIKSGPDGVRGVDGLRAVSRSQNHFDNTSFPSDPLQPLQYVDLRRFDGNDNEGYLYLLEGENRAQVVPRYSSFDGVPVTLRSSNDRQIYVNYDVPSRPPKSSVLGRPTEKSGTSDQMETGGIQSNLSRSVSIISDGKRSQAPAAFLDCCGSYTELRYDSSTHNDPKNNKSTAAFDAKPRRCLPCIPDDSHYLKPSIITPADSDKILQKVPVNQNAATDPAHFDEYVSVGEDCNPNEEGVFCLVNLPVKADKDSPNKNQSQNTLVSSEYMDMSSRRGFNRSISTQEEGNLSQSKLRHSRSLDNELDMPDYQNVCLTKRKTSQGSPAGSDYLKSQEDSNKRASTLMQVKSCSDLGASQTKNPNPKELSLQRKGVESLRTVSESVCMGNERSIEHNFHEASSYSENSSKLESSCRNTLKTYAAHSQDLHRVTKSLQDQFNFSPPPATLVNCVTKPSEQTMDYVNYPIPAPSLSPPPPLPPKAAIKSHISQSVVAPTSLDSISEVDHEPVPRLPEKLRRKPSPIQTSTAADGNNSAPPPIVKRASLVNLYESCPKPPIHPRNSFSVFPTGIGLQSSPPPPTLQSRQGASVSSLCKEPMATSNWPFPGTPKQKKPNLTVKIEDSNIDSGPLSSRAVNPKLSELRNSSFRSKVGSDASECSSLFSYDDHPRPSPALTTMRPRFGKEYGRVDRRRLDDNLSLPYTPSNKSPSINSTVFTFDNISQMSRSVAGNCSSGEDSPKYPASIRSRYTGDHSSLSHNGSPAVYDPDSPRSIDSSSMVNYADIDISAMESPDNINRCRPGVVAEKDHTIYAVLDLIATNAVSHVGREHAQNRIKKLEEKEQLEERERRAEARQFDSKGSRTSVSGKGTLPLEKKRASEPKRASSLNSRDTRFAIFHPS